MLETVCEDVQDTQDGGDAVLRFPRHTGWWRRYVKMSKTHRMVETVCEDVQDTQDGGDAV